MAVVLTERVDLGPGVGGYRFRIEKPTSHDRDLYEAGKRFEEIVRRQTETREKAAQDVGKK